VAGAADLVLAIDRLEASSGALALLRLQHLVLAGLVDLDDDQRAEVDRLCGTGSETERVGVAADATAADVRTAALAGVERWRARAGSPLSDRRLVEAAEIVSRAYEEIYTSAG
jgi:hypothetical protein